MTASWILAILASWSLQAAVLVGAGGFTYVVALFAMGFRLRELRGV